MKNKKNRIITSFPKNLIKEVESVLKVINFKILKNELSEETFKISLDNNENIYIPYRIYFEEISQNAFENFSTIQKSILCCLYTRHHNGYVREKYLGLLKLQLSEEILKDNEEWIIPFVMKLVGEYVIELIDLSKEIIDKFSDNAIETFKVKNPSFIRTLRSQIISYWNEYYRKDYPELWGEGYVGFKVYKTYID